MFVMNVYSCEISISIFSPQGLFSGSEPSEIAPNLKVKLSFSVKIFFTVTAAAGGHKQASLCVCEKEPTEQFCTD